MQKPILLTKKNLCLIRGFSLVELLVIIFIISLLSTLTLVNYREGQKRYAVNSAVQRMAADLRRAQNSALAVKTEATGIPYGYGFYARDNDSGYYFFYNTAATPKYYSGNVDSPQPADISKQLDKIILPAGVTFSSRFYRANNTPIPPGQVGLPDQRSSIYFESPDPTTFIAGNSDPNSNDDRPVRRDIILQSGSLTKTITIYLSGKIDIQ